MLIKIDYVIIVVIIIGIKKCEGKFSNDEIDSQLRTFISKYKKHTDIEENKIKIEKKEIKVSFR